MMLAIIDYGVGNLYSLASSLKYLGVSHEIITQPEQLAHADRIILPGVGAFEDAAKKLKETGMREALLHEVQRGKPLLGICLGMQLLFERSYEYGVHEGLGLIPGEIRPLKDVLPTSLKVPHIGWNRLTIVNGDPLFAHFHSGEHVYYVHSYYATHCEKHTLATSEYGVEVTGVVRKDQVYGAQFHPEKSGDAGLRLLSAFAEM